MIISILKYCKQKFLLYSINKKFRKHNRHNNTQLKTDIPLELISVGKKSYGDLNISYGSPEKYKLLIGNYVSIAPDVLFLLANEHSTKSISTYPFKILEFGMGPEAKGKGDIIIKDDVWICARAIICSGVTVGQGAVIASGSVVTKDVPPYAIVGGFPAKILKYRFSDDIIERLLSINIADLFDSFCEKNLDFIYDENLSIEKINKFLSSEKFL
ncbi:MAG: CatB-related O-acetyltransferase [Treponemataceae bacterium]